MNVEPITRLVGHLAVPGDKSISHRAVLIGAICDGETRITGFGRSADTEATVEAMRALGIEVVEHGHDTLSVFGDRKSTRLNSSHIQKSRMPSSA